MTLVVSSSAQLDGNVTSLLNSYEDPYPSGPDLAFLLATHGYNATPVDGHVMLILNGTAYRLTPFQSNTVVVEALCDH